MKYKNSYSDYGALSQMTYDEIVLACEQLKYRDKFRLSQLLIQIARKEEENANPQKRIENIVLADKANQSDLTSFDPVEYAIPRLLKLRPSKITSLSNSIRAMFQFQGGISESDIDGIISGLKKRKLIKIEQNNVIYER